jgi:N-acetylneuraminic acid mutarotase
MQSMNIIHKILILLFGVAISVQAVPPVLNYAGQVAVNGEAFDGNGLFKFALVNADGTTTYWSNDGTSVDGSEPQASVAVAVNGGLYSILLGNTAQQGMGAIDPAVFAQHNDAKLRVWFSDRVNGFQQLSPDRPFASVPYAFSSESSKTAETALNAETAKTADSANVATTAMAVEAGAVTSSMLASNAVTSDKLSPQIKADINATIGMNRLSSEVTEKLNQEKTTTNYNAPSVGSLLAVPSGSSAPAGYSLYQRGEIKEFGWQKKAPVSLGRYAYDGVEVLGGKIYFVGGDMGGSAKNIAERYDPVTNTWETLNSMSVARKEVACAVLIGKLHAIGGRGLSSVEIYDPSTESWSTGASLPSVVRSGAAITVGGKIYLIGGLNGSEQTISQVICFDPSTNQWQTKESMPKAKRSAKLIWFKNRIWAIGGTDQNGDPSNNVESYDPSENTWQTEASLNSARFWPIAWVGNGGIFVGIGKNESLLDTIEFYDPLSKSWNYIGKFPYASVGTGSAVLNGSVYAVSGFNGNGNYPNKVFAADLNASVEGIYDLYRKDGDAPGTPVVQSEYADGSVTGSKIASKTIGKDQISDSILKYLKPEITTQPQASVIYAGEDGSVAFSAEGKYLTYQWKKDGVDLTSETNATLNIIDANASNHDGNYSVVVSNDFGSVQSGVTEIVVATTWIPLALPRLELWLDASDVSNVIKDSNNLVSELRDKSSNKFHAVQYNVSRQPTYTASNSLLNNKPSVLSTSAFGSIGLITPLITFQEIFIVAYYKGGIETSFGDYNTLLAGGGHNGAYRIMGMRNSPNWNLEGAFNDGGNFKNGTTDSSITILPLPPTVLRFVSSSAKSQHTGILYNPLFNDRGWVGGIGEIVALESLSSISDRQKIEGYLAHKWGLAASLPTGHPYKTNAP